MAVNAKVASSKADINRNPTNRRSGPDRAASREAVTATRIGELNLI